MPIELRQLAHTYMAGTAQAVSALRNFSLQIDDGEFVGIMGHTGCGKSTLIQLIAGLFPPTSGSIFIDGEDINAKNYDRSVLRRKVGIVFQYPEYQLFERTVEKDVAFGLKHSGLDRGEASERVRHALELMGFDFEKIRRQSPLALSGGEKRRVAIAGVLAAKPKILIFDEPIAGLDPLGRDAFLQLVERLNSEGTTIIMVSHNADAIGEFSRRIVVLDGGELISDGTPAEVFADAERMRALRLGVSAAGEISSLLTQRGMLIPAGIVKYDALLETLKSRLGGERP